jgi:exopolysaccharide production protein ExoY
MREFSGRIGPMEPDVSTEVVSIYLTKDAEIPLWKRILDASVVVVTMPLWLPVTIIIALIIKLVSRGPVLFTQERIGYLGRPFKIYKFRTMHVNAETNSHASYLNDLINSSAPMIKLDLHGDKRLIRFGGLLRATGLDELPQLLNVIKGDMSLVGPRPCLPYEYEKYLPWHTERLNALPGLTGLWQVSGKNKTTFEQMVRLDIYYAEHQSLSSDLKIMLKTFPVLAVQVWEAIAKRLPRRNEGTAGWPRRAIPLERSADAGALAQRLTKTQKLTRTCKEMNAKRA